MKSMDFAQLAERLGLDLDQVLEIASLGGDLPSVAAAPVAGCATRPGVVLDAVRLDHSRAQRARPETDEELRFADAYADRWSD